MTEQAGGRRAGLVEAAQARWIAALTDLGGRNTLLYYKDRRAGTLDLAAADPTALEGFLQTGSIRLTRLFHDADARADAIRRVQAIYRKARELLEERGIRAGYLATGMARWDELFLEPAAPVLLRGLTITATRARHDDFDLTLDDDNEVNPVLLHKLASQFGAATEMLADEPADKVPALLEEAALAAEVPGFEIIDRRVIGTFTYAKLPMVRDLQAAGDLLADSDVVAAIAGDPEAQELLAADTTDAGTADPSTSACGPGVALDSPEDDYSVLDADSSQRSAIAAVVDGRSLVIHGPPGTGKSQTIANLIAALVARGRKVLFVAEKRAAIDAVLSRLKGVDLGDVVLDIHDGTRDRVRIARDLGNALEGAQRAADPDVGNLHRRLTDRQRRLSQHVAALHEKHQPWAMTPFEVQSALLGIPEEARTRVRLAMPERIDAREADQIRDELREFAHLGGFSIRPEGTPWFGARLGTADQARQACDLAARLSSRVLPLLGHRIIRACEETGLRTPASYAEGSSRMRLYAAIASTLSIFSADVFAAARTSSPGQPGTAAASACAKATGCGSRPARCSSERLAGPGTAKSSPARSSPRCSRRQRTSSPSGRNSAPARAAAAVRPGCRPACRTCRPCSRTASSSWHSCVPAFRSPTTGWKTGSPRWPPTRTPRGNCPACTSSARGSTRSASARCSTSWPAARQLRISPRPPSTTPGTPRSWTRSGSSTRDTPRTTAPRLTRSPVTSGFMTCST